MEAAPKGAGEDAAMHAIDLEQESNEMELGKVRLAVATIEGKLDPDSDSESGSGSGSSSSRINKVDENAANDVYQTARGLSFVEQQDASSPLASEEKEQPRIPEDATAWERHETEDGFPYWYNPGSGNSQWEDPHAGKEIDNEILTEVETPKGNEDCSENTTSSAALSAKAQALRVITMVHDAVRRDALEEVRGFVLAGIDVNAQDAQGRTPLFGARSEPMVSLLLQLGAQANVVEPGTGQQAMHAYAANGLLEPLQALVETLVDEGGMLSSLQGLVDFQGRTPLHLAATSGHTACSKLLARLRCVDGSSGSLSFLMDVVDADGCLARDLASSDLASTFDEIMTEREAQKLDECLAQLASCQAQLDEARASRDQWEETAREALTKQALLANENAELRESLAAYEYFQGQTQGTGVDDYYSQLQPEYEPQQAFLRNPQTEFDARPEMRAHVSYDENAWHQTELAPSTPPAHPETDADPSMTPANHGWARSPSPSLHERHSHPHESDVVSTTSSTAISSERIGKVWAKFFERAAKASLSRHLASNDHLAITPVERSPDDLLRDAIDDADPEAALQAMMQDASLEDDKTDASMLHRCCSKDTSANKAMQRNLVEIASLLVEYGADIELADGQGATPLHLAASAGNALVVRWLLQSAASTQVIDENGDAPLHCAAVGLTKGHLKCVQLLAQYGANLTQLNAQGNSALDCARLQVVMLDDPPKALRQTVDLLEQLVAVAGGEENPLSGEITEARPNPYRVANLRDAYARVPPQTDARSEDSGTAATPSEGDAEDNGEGWLSNIFGKVLRAKSPSQKEAAEDPSPSMNQQAPPSDRQLAQA
ncbi:Ankyrin repeat domain-containing protein 27 [Hondaea fermentalgiana]|uniref:Ankyrin repeat domain-containing protein 27 n=1 Tax=Hondaea fermentalgiana TaxID=2315210 RepID=A0A2R5GDW0_9STRA|nr:Ankyrin repeat domain-containing protein 27 [Hondaea fermentalgiana]|eukprot:GBG28519.1 Ankyrin repeat domain-containing protein 27 [Hondaea fermentalgiana]